MNSTFGQSQTQFSRIVVIRTSYVFFFGWSGAGGRGAVAISTCTHVGSAPWYDNCTLG